MADSNFKGQSPGSGFCFSTILTWNWIDGALPLTKKCLSGVRADSGVFRIDLLSCGREKEARRARDGA
jgi:hypothetical protein